MPLTTCHTRKRTHHGSQKKRGGPISRLLSRAAIDLGRLLPAGSCALPGPYSGTGHPAVLLKRAYPQALAQTVTSAPICACIGRAVAVPGLSPAPRWALTPPFHPYLCSEEPSAVCSLLPAPEVTPGGRYPHPYPVMAGLSSRFQSREHKDRRSQNEQPPGPPRKCPRHVSHHSALF